MKPGTVKTLRTPGPGMIVIEVGWVRLDDGGDHRGSASARSSSLITLAASMSLSFNSRHAF